MRRLSGFLVLLFVVTACSAPAVPTAPLPEKGTSPASDYEGRAIKPDAIELKSGSALLSALRGGGYVVYFRHFHSDHSVWHEDPIKARQGEMSVKDIRGSCEEQRPLSEYGRTRAKDVGAAIKKLGIPVGSVFASPYCRVIESALLLAGRPPDAILYDLMHRGGTYNEDMQNRNIRQYLTQIPAAGTNTLLMAHRPQMDYIKFIEEGEAFVFRPKGDGSFDLVGTIYDSEWLEALVNPEYLGWKVLQEGGDAPSRDLSAVLPTALSSDLSRTSILTPPAPAPAATPAPASTPAAPASPQKSPEKAGK